MKFPLVEISNVAQFMNGFAFKSSDWESAGLPIIRIQNLTNPDKPFNYTTKNVAKKYLVKQGDILVSWSATIEVFEWKKSDALLNQHIFNVRFEEEKVDKEYFKIVLKNTINELSRFAHGSTMKHIVKKDFESHKIPLPSVNDQKRIARLLGKVESIIAQRKQHLQQLDDLLKSVFIEIFGFDGEEYKKWETDLLSSYSEIVSGVTKGKKYKTENLIETPYMRVANVQDGFFILDEIKTIFVSQKEIDKYLLRKGDLLLTEGGDIDKLGRGSVWEGQVPNCIHQNHIFRVRVNDENKLNAEFLSALVGSRYGKSYFLKAAKKTTGIASINSTQLKAFPVVIPPIELQNKFSAIVEKVEKIKSTYQQSLNDLEQLYGALSQKAFKGELDLSRIMLNDSDEMFVKGSDKIGPSFELQVIQNSTETSEVELIINDRTAFISNKLQRAIKKSEGEVSAQSLLGGLNLSEFEYKGEPAFETLEDYELLKKMLFESIEMGGIQQTYQEVDGSLSTEKAKRVVLKH